MFYLFSIVLSVTINSSLYISFFSNFIFFFFYFIFLFFFFYSFYCFLFFFFFFFFSSRRRHTRSLCDWSSDVCSSDLTGSLYIRCVLEQLFVALNCGQHPRSSDHSFGTSDVPGPACTGVEL